MKAKAPGFTLIELLIVVAIIGILAAIAVPNFLNAQTRAKVSRAVSDIRNLDLAIRSYMMDNNFYPVRSGWMDERYIPLTTPISYMGSVPLDPFNPDPLNTTGGRAKDSSNRAGNYDYWTRYWANGSSKSGSYWDAKTAFPANRYEYQLRGFGPTMTWIPALVYPTGHSKVGEYVDYNMSNGLYSEGNIIRYGP